MNRTTVVSIMKTALAATMLALAAPETPHATHLNTVNALTLSPMAAELMELPFFGCQICSNDCEQMIRHRARYHPWDAWWRPDGAHTSMDHGCDGINGHGYCDDPGNHYLSIWCFLHDPSLASVLDVVKSGDPERIAELTSRPDGRVELNFERSAIQIWGCGDQLVAHLPVVLLDE